MVVFLWVLLDLIIEFCMFGWWVFYIFLMFLIPMSICRFISRGKTIFHYRGILGLVAGLLILLPMAFFMIWCEFGTDGLNDILNNLGDYLVFFDISD